MKLTLKAARVNAKLTQQEASDIIGVSAITISNWEQGKNKPNLKYAPAIEKAYNIAFADIIF